MSSKAKPQVVFITAFLGLLLLNIFIVAILSKSIGFALEQFLSLKIFLVPIAVGFGLQAALYSLIKAKNALLMIGSGSINTGTMVACCTHHIADLLPLLAIGGISTFLVSTQKYLLLGALVLNWLIVIYLYKKFKEVHEK